MKAIAVLLLVILQVVNSIPLENPAANADPDSKTLASQVRQKRGWGYETAWAPSYAPVYSTSVLGPSRTVISSPAAVAVAPATTTYVVPQKVAVPVSHHHAESFVFSSGPDHTYYVHQRHSPHTYYYHYPATTSVLAHYPTTHYVASAPVVSTWP